MDIRKTHVVLDPSEIPFDVTFVIEECGSEVKAHKFIMAMGSPMCMKQFYGALKETEDTIVIKSTTKDAFVTMVDFFYGKEVHLAKKNIEELFEVANIAEKYQIEALKEKLQEVAQKFPLNEENVVTVASIADNFSQFGTLANTILIRCSEFLSSVLTVPDDFSVFANKFVETEQAVIALKLLAGMKKVNPTVKNCCMLKTCRRGKPMLDIADFVVGDSVQFYYGCAGGIVRRIEIENSWDGYGEVLLDGRHTWYHIKGNNGATFRFCKC